MHTAQIQTLYEQASLSLTSLSRNPNGLAVIEGISESISEFVGCFSHRPAYQGYKYTPSKARQIYESVKQRAGIAKCREFLFACITYAIGATLKSDAFNRLPNRVKDHQLKQYKRILENASKDVAFCELDNDLFLKEFGLALVRLYAAGAQVIDPCTGIGRSMLFKNGFLEMPKRLLIFIRLGGFKPFFEIHTHAPYLDEFNEEGWNECYRCCVELYELHPEILGMYGGSWFYDPVLAKHSPRLNYLRDTPLEGGAFLLYSSTSEQSIHDATATSPTRKKLYDEGQYLPKSYALLWPRDAQINWVKTYA